VMPSASSSRLWCFYRFWPLLLCTPALPANAPLWTVLSVEDTRVPYVYGTSAMAASGDVYWAGPGYCTTPDPPYQVSCVTKTAASGQVFAVQIQGATVNTLALDQDGNAYVTGRASSGFSATPGAYESSSPGAYDTFVCKIGNADGHLLFCTFIDVFITSAQSFAVDPAGNTYFAGLCPGDPVHVCVEKLNPSGTALTYSTPTFLFGPEAQGSPAALLVVDAQGNLFAADWMGAVVKLNATGTLTGTIYPTLEQLVAVAVDPAGDFQVLLSGQESGSAANFFVHRYSADLSTVLFDAPLSIPSGQVYGMSIDPTGVTNIWGYAAASLIPVHATAPCSPGVNAFLARIDGTGDVAQLTFLNTPNSFVFGAPMFFSFRGTYLVSAGPDWEMVFLGPTTTELSLTCIVSGASLSELPLAPNDIVTLLGAISVPTRRFPRSPMLPEFFHFNLVEPR
jgi:hypothetical protein